MVAQEYRDVFTAAGLGPTFVEDLRAAVEDIQVTLADRTGKRGAQAGATSGIETALNACNRYKAVLDSFIRTDARDDASLLSRWSIIKRVPRPRSRRKKDGEASAPPQAESKAEPNAAPNATPAVTVSPPILDPSRLLAAPAADTRNERLAVVVATIPRESSLQPQQLGAAVSASSS
jgi:hypothetical protein